MEDVNAVVQVFTYILQLIGTFTSFVFSNWVMSLFFAGSIILFILNLVISSSGADE